MSQEDVNKLSNMQLCSEFIKQKKNIKGIKDNRICKYHRYSFKPCSEYI